MAESAMRQARAVIGDRFGAECVPARPRRFRTGPGSAQEAHEAIRPTDFGRTPESAARRLDRDAAALYGLIWRRALASQMAAARVERVRIAMASEDGALRLSAECAATAFDGHLRLAAGEETADGETAGERELPGLQSGDRVAVSAVRAERHVTAPPQRFTEAGLVRRLEERGIGRPSTWAAILAVLQERGYAVLHDRRLVPTERGRVLTAFLEHGFGRWMDYGFTAAMEADADAGRDDDLIPLRAKALDRTQAHDLARLLAVALLLPVAAPGPDLPVGCGLEALDVIALVDEAAPEQVHQIGARVSLVSHCRCLHRPPPGPCGRPAGMASPRGRPPAAPVTDELSLSTTRKRGRGERPGTAAPGCQRGRRRI